MWFSVNRILTFTGIFPDTSPPYLTKSPPIRTHFLNHRHRYHSVPVDGFKYELTRDDNETTRSLVVGIGESVTGHMRNSIPVFFKNLCYFQAASPLW